jgi:hypothetical protein
MYTLFERQKPGKHVLELKLTFSLIVNIIN